MLDIAVHLDPSLQLQQAKFCQRNLSMTMKSDHEITSKICTYRKFSKISASQLFGTIFQYDIISLIKDWHVLCLMAALMYHGEYW